MASTKTQAQQDRITRIKAQDATATTRTINGRLFVDHNPGWRDFTPIGSFDFVRHEITADGTLLGWGHPGDNPEGTLPPQVRKTRKTRRSTAQETATA